jgi:MFS family permease
MKQIFENYRHIDRDIYHLILAEWMIQIINASFLILVNYYLLDLGYKDYEVAKFTSYRYISVLLFGIPFGFLYKKIQLLPLIRIGSILFIFNSIAIIVLAPYHLDWLMHILMFFFGIFLLMSHIAAMPFLMRIVDPSKISLTLSLYFQTWAAAIIFIGIVTFLYHCFFNNSDGLGSLLIALFSSASLAIYLLFKIKNVDTKPKKVISKSTIDKIDWKEWIRIGRILFPTTLIAIGAGFCIPFFSLFFYFTYQLDAAQYSNIVSFSHILVLGFMMCTPWIRRTYGYKFGIIGIQALGILSLIILTWAHHWLALPYSMWLALTTFALRQPLMNSAQPLIAEFTLEKVGQRNQPLVQSIEATIWAGSFWISSLIFSSLREANVSYSTIFNITILLYVFGVITWFFVFNSFEKEDSKST